MSNIIEPFTPTLLGTGTVGQFKTVATLGPGFYLACLASVVIVIGLYFHRRAYKPLLEARKAYEKAQQAQR